MNSLPSIDVVLPIHNEAELVLKTISEIANYLSPLCQLRIIVVDDGSEDESWSLISESSFPDAKVTGIKLSRRFGKEAAVCAGLERASADAVIVMDADLQHPPSLLPDMFKAWNTDGFEVVECVKKNRGQEPLLKRSSLFFIFGLFEKALHVPLKDASDYKLLSAKVLTAWLSLPERNVFFRGMSWWLGFKRTTISFDVADREEGQSGWNLSSLANLLLTGVTAYSSLPMRIVSFAGVCFSLFAAMMIVFAFWKKLYGEALTGFTTVIILQLIIGSIIMLSLGIIGEYLAKIYDEVKGRPRYLISEETHSNADKDLV